jgi:hypothetical protein
MVELITENPRAFIRRHHTQVQPAAVGVHAGSLGEAAKLTFVALQSGPTR